LLEIYVDFIGTSEFSQTEKYVGFEVFKKLIKVYDSKEGLTIAAYLI